MARCGTSDGSADTAGRGVRVPGAAARGPPAGGGPPVTVAAGGTSVAGGTAVGGTSTGVGRTLTSGCARGCFLRENARVKRSLALGLGGPTQHK